MPTTDRYLAGALISDHPLRENILAEMHARPYQVISTPRFVLRTAFFCDPNTKLNDDYSVFSSWCKRNGLTPPSRESRQHTTMLDDIRLTWERHTEFVTLTWDCAAETGAQNKLEQHSHSHSCEMIASPLVLISASLIELRKEQKDLQKLQYEFNIDSLCMSRVGNSDALLATDFRQNEMGATRFVIENKGLNDITSGIIIRKLLEVETYRSLALLGFEEAKAITPSLNKLEQRIIELTSEMDDKNDLQTTRQSLDEIMEIAGQLTNMSAITQYRLSATRAYYDLVLARLMRLGEVKIDGYSRMEEFLRRRLAPAMRTCQTIEKRLNIAREKLAEAAALLRTKVDIQMQDQNHTLLQSMNERAKMQYHLQRTVEGLSIAAVSYYVVGLLAYIFKGVTQENQTLTSKIVAISVPIVVFIIWMSMRRIRQKIDKPSP